jgi:MinD-like ATPase involved in chromosome partitioning or flagellar assembly
LKAPELPVRIIIVGPPHSGKSTLAENLAKAMLKLGVDAYAEDLDLASPTLDFIRGKVGWERRLTAKKPWTMDLAKEAASIFLKASEKHTVVIGDAPGKISAESEEIAKAATHGIILCREDSTAEIAKWRELLTKLGVETVCVAVSKISGDGNVKSNGLIEATLAGLDRKTRDDPAITSLALLLKGKLGV